MAEREAGRRIIKPENRAETVRISSISRTLFTKTKFKVSWDCFCCEKQSGGFQDQSHKTAFGESSFSIILYIRQCTSFSVLQPHLTHFKPNQSCPMEVFSSSLCNLISYSRLNVILYCFVCCSCKIYLCQCTTVYETTFKFTRSHISHLSLPRTMLKKVKDPEPSPWCSCPTKLMGLHPSTSNLCIILLQTNKQTNKQGWKHNPLVSVACISNAGLNCCVVHGPCKIKQ